MLITCWKGEEVRVVCSRMETAERGLAWPEMLEMDEQEGGGEQHAEAQDAFLARFAAALRVDLEKLQTQPAGSPALPVAVPAPPKPRRTRAPKAAPSAPSAAARRGKSKAAGGGGSDPRHEPWVYRFDGRVPAVPDVSRSGAPEEEKIFDAFATLQEKLTSRFGAGASMVQQMQELDISAAIKAGFCSYWPWGVCSEAKNPAGRRKGAKRARSLPRPTGKTSVPKAPRIGANGAGKPKAVTVDGESLRMKQSREAAAARRAWLAHQAVGRKRAAAFWRRGIEERERSVKLIQLARAERDGPPRDPSKSGWIKWRPKPHKWQMHYHAKRADAGGSAGILGLVGHEPGFVWNGDDEGPGEKDDELAADIEAMLDGLDESPGEDEQLAAVIEAMMYGLDEGEDDVDDEEPAAETDATMASAPDEGENDVHDEGRAGEHDELADEIEAMICGPHEGENDVHDQGPAGEGDEELAAVAAAMLDMACPERKKGEEEAVGADDEEPAATTDDEGDGEESEFEGTSDGDTGTSGGDDSESEDLEI